ncbi:DNA polymerase III subunit delta' [Phormidium sp. CLA17]|uniref:DNA polymerase III subunit delta' n=1 Tax=Leptolyngbya sp. Cla-17 TaxID=2803751 RepID=UPI001492AF13|nr:DNA polymerase III subunit delta' [Leptolyngbya sp. Cla-17]MBM0743591.1 DNA polymerase III subunit delta' [Leptolyngbya sp. Cla-17]
MSPFSHLIGQSQAIQMLTQAVSKQRIAPAYLFAGSAGIGRGVAAECFIELVFSQGKSSGQKAILRSRIQQRNHPDLLWVEPTYTHQGKLFSPAEAEAAGLKRKTAPLIRLEQIRGIARFLARSPLEAERSIVVVEQAETMAEAPANALLKTLEEPGQATLILIVPGTESLLPTLISRCQKIPFYRLPLDDMLRVLQRANQADILQQPEILQLAQGSPGAAIAHWQKLQELPDDLLQALRQPIRSHRDALSLARQIAQTLEPEAQLWLIDYLQQIWWQQITNGIQLVTQSALSPLQHLEKARTYLRRNVQPRLVWEVTLMAKVGT